MEPLILPVIELIEKGVSMFSRLLICAVIHRPRVIFCILADFGKMPLSLTVQGICCSQLEESALSARDTLNGSVLKTEPRVSIRLPRCLWEIGVRAGKLPP